MSMTFAYLVVAVVGFLILGGVTLICSKVFNTPVFGATLLPVKLLFMLVLGFCVAFTINGFLARFADIDMREWLEQKFDQ